MNTAIPTLPPRTSLRAAATMLLVLGLSGTALAIDQPPQEPEQQRVWLVGHLVTDMQTIGTFRSDEVAEMVSLVNALTDDQTSLFARFYCLTRAKTEVDARLYAIEASDTEEVLAEARAEVADLLARLRRQIRRTYRELATMNPDCQTLCEVVYASIPGWCEFHNYAIPDWYFGDGGYIGPILSARYAGAYAVPAYKAFYDHSSRHDWRDGGKHFHENVIRNPKGDHGGSSSYATTANKHPHPKTPHGTALPTKHGPPKATHSSPAAAAKHGKHSRARTGTPPSAKHDHQSKAARHGNPKSKPTPRSQPHRQQPKPTAHAPKGRPEAHAHRAAHGQAKAKSGHARQK